MMQGESLADVGEARAGALQLCGSAEICRNLILLCGSQNLCCRQRHLLISEKIGLRPSSRPTRTPAPPEMFKSPE